MKKLFTVIILLIPFIAVSQPFIPQQTLFEVNNISTWIQNTGTFNRDIRTPNAPGLMWPKNSNKFAILTSGFNIAANVNNQLKMSSASYNGEYRPGYSNNGNFYTNSSFKLYSVKRGDNYITNPDWLNWGLMVPYGAPFIDMNNNGTYEYAIDTPGVKNSLQTIFVCLTDGDANRHTSAEGFGGGTSPLFSEVHLTAWANEQIGLENVQFFKWEIVNKNNLPWDNVHLSIFCDFDLGDPTDDYSGSDPSISLAYGYNSDDIDGTGNPFEYGSAPPAVGICLLRGASLNNVDLNATSVTTLGISDWTCPTNISEVSQAFNYMRGFKNDGTQMVIPNTNPPQTTKFSFSGSWTEDLGFIQNCNGSLTGNHIMPSPPGDRKFVISTGSDGLQMNPGEKQTIYAAQIVARSTSNLGSVIALRNTAVNAIAYFNFHFPTGVNTSYVNIPGKFSLYQNYPNPFNPVTTISFDLPKAGMTKITVYDVAGKEVKTLINEFREAGTFDINFNAVNLASGIYFYKLELDVAIEPGEMKKYSDVKKMTLLK